MSFVCTFLLSVADRTFFFHLNLYIAIGMSLFFIHSVQMQTQNFTQIDSKWKWKEKLKHLPLLHLSATYFLQCIFNVFFFFLFIHLWFPFSPVFVDFWNQTTDTATSLVLSLWCSFPLMRFPLCARAFAVNTVTIRLAALMHHSAIYSGVPSIALHIIYVSFVLFLFLVCVELQ